jgi:hypothetical protein
LYEDQVNNFFESIRKSKYDSDFITDNDNRWAIWTRLRGLDFNNSNGDSYYSILPNTTKCDDLIEDITTSVYTFAKNQENNLNELAALFKI